MTQLVVRVEDYASVSVIKKAISLIRGVADVVVEKQEPIETKEYLDDIPEDVRNLVGIASFTKKEVVDDERLAYILGK